MRFRVGSINAFSQNSFFPAFACLSLMSLAVAKWQPTGYICGCSNFIIQYSTAVCARRLVDDAANWWLVANRQNGVSSRWCLVVRWLRVCGSFLKPAFNAAQRRDATCQQQQQRSVWRHRWWIAHFTMMTMMTIDDYVNRFVTTRYWLNINTTSMSGLELSCFHEMHQASLILGTSPSWVQSVVVPWLAI